MLPARLPNILLNGTTGIAVGMATDIPPHNLREVAQAAITLIENRRPRSTNCWISFTDPTTRPKPKSLLHARRSAKSTRTAAVRCGCARYGKKEDGAVVITALPHQVSGARVLEQIAAQMRNKSCRWLTICAMSRTTKTRLAW